jgi:hypothetical protein
MRDSYHRGLGDANAIATPRPIALFWDGDGSRLDNSTVTVLTGSFPDGARPPLLPSVASAPSVVASDRRPPHSDGGPEETQWEKVSPCGLLYPCLLKAACRWGSAPGRRLV